MTYDPELKCQACGRVGQNESEPTGEIIGDTQLPLNDLAIHCKCGHQIKYIEDYKND
jgi:hypothetical protein